MEDREFLFRGVTANNNFAYGMISKDQKGTTAYYKEYSQRICWYREDGAHCNVPVKNGTLGQFTGKLDIFGERIFEGDIVLCSDGLYRKIWWSEDEASFKASHLKNEKYCEPLYLMEDNFEKVGNIYNLEEEN